MRQISFGTRPVRSVACNCRLVSLVHLPNSVGTVPRRGLVKIQSDSKLVHKLISVGRVPVRESACKSTTRKFVKRPNSVGIVPCNALEFCSSKVSRLVNLPKVTGNCLGSSPVGKSLS